MHSCSSVIWVITIRVCVCVCVCVSLIFLTPMKHIRRTLSLEDPFLRVHAGKSDEINTIMLWITSRRSKIHPPTQSLTLTHQDIYKTVNSRRVHFAVIDEYPSKIEVL